MNSNQYTDPTRLNARIDLHRRFSTNPYGWYRWVFDQFDLPSSGRILELGCGAGNLWISNSDRMPARLSIVLSDNSPGMLMQARKSLTYQQELDPVALISEAAARPPTRYVVVDAGDLPFPKSSFQVVIANHMLYHVRDLQQTLQNISMILTPGGKLYATTIGNNHLVEMKALFQAFDPGLDFADMGVDNFNLENGPGQVASVFDQVTLQRYTDTLKITEAKPLASYMASCANREIVGEEFTRLIKWLEEQIRIRKELLITKDSGMILAENPTP
jgi:SAM-dependent methyltransferase